MTRLEQMQNIVSTQSWGMVEGVPVDMQTAQLFIIVHNKVGTDNQQKMEQKDLRTIFKTIWSIVK